MADWFRQTSWSPEIEEEFFRRLARARPFKRRQYMYIQALTWMEADHRHAPEVLRVLERYPTDAEVGAPSEPRFFDAERMDFLYVRADARRWAGDLDGAVADFREMTSYLRPHKCIIREDIRFAQLVLEEGLVALDEEAYALLHETMLDDPFPQRRFARALARARLAHRLGRTSEASAHAQDALRETTFTRTQMRNHPHLGLVQSPDPGVLDELHWLADPSSRH